MPNAPMAMSPPYRLRPMLMSTVTRQAHTFSKNGDMPMEKMLETIFQRSRNVPCRKCTVLFGLRKWLNTHTIPTHCDNTVAIAAPRMPHFSQKMNIGARMMFMPTVNTAESMAFCGYPVARMMWLSPNMVQVTGRPYRMICMKSRA